MRIFHNTIGGTALTYGQTTFDQWALGGSFRELSSPNGWRSGGYDFFVGYAANTLNNEVYILRFDGYEVNGAQVNSGTDGPEPLNHAAPAIFIDESTGYVYVMQNEFHVDRFGVWKSDYPLLDNSGSFDGSFTFVDWFDTDGSYLSLIEYSGTTCVFSTRSGSSPNGYDFNVLTVDLETPSGYTDQLTVEMDFATNDVRAYLIPCNYYGSPTTRVYGIQSRYEPTSVYYKISLLFSSDQENFENLSGGTTTDVTSAAITYSSLNTNYTVIGSDSSKTTNIAPPMLLQLNDDIYLVYQSASDTMTLNKYTKDSDTVQATFDFPYTYTLSSSGDGYTYLYYDGQRIVGTTKVDSSTCYKFAIETSLTGYVEQRQLDTPDGAYIGMPWNMDDVTGLYAMVGRSVIGSSGVIPYIITNE